MPAALNSVRLNNQGVRYIESGRFEEAIDVLTDALSIVKQELIYDEQSVADTDIQESMVTEPEMDETATSGAIASPQRRLSLCEPTADNATSPVLSERETIESAVFDDQPYVYKAAIRISESDLQELVPSYVNISFIVLFNLALSHHLSAIQHNMCPTILNKALTLYELAYALQMREQIPAPIIYSMALVNNLAQIHRNMKREASARQCFEHLLATIMLITTSGQGSLLEHADGFFLSLMHLVLAETSTAPAA
jgi:tetratricopeptide (TPR) repeat protein